MQKNLNIEKINQVVQMKFLAMHITNKKLSFNISMIGNVQNIFMEHDLKTNDFWHKIKKYNCDPYNVLLSITTDIPVLLMTDIVLQRHINNLMLI